MQSTHVQIVYRRLNRHMSKMLYLMKKGLSTGPCKLLMFFIINDVKRKKYLSSGRKIISAMKSYIIWENQWDNYVFFLSFSLKKEKNLFLRGDIKYELDKQNASRQSNISLLIINYIFF